MNVYVNRSYFAETLGLERITRGLAPFTRWVEQLDPDLATCCRSLLGSEVAYSNLVNLPFLVAEPFGLGLDHEWITELVAGNAFMLTYFLASDQLVDCPARAHRFLVLLATRLHVEMWKHYDRVAPGRAAHIWGDLVADHVRGVLAEEAHHAACRAGRSPLDLLAYQRLVVEKNRYGMAAIPLLAAATGNREPEERLRQMYDCIAVEIEFDDDLKDWREDVTEGRFTPVVSALAAAAPHRADPDVLAAALVTSPAIASMLDLVQARLDEALQTLSNVRFSCVLLRQWIERHRAANQHLKAEYVARQVRSILARSVAAPPPGSTSREVPHAG